MRNRRVDVEIGTKRPYELEITTHDVVMRGLPDALNGARIVHLTDFHAGFGSTGPVFEEIVRRVEEICPDYLFLTGDYLDDAPHASGYAIGDLISRLHSRHGIFGSYGNHDHRRGPEGTRVMLERAGVRVVNNGNLVTQEGLSIAGVDDLSHGQPDLAAAMRSTPEDRTTLLLSHNPRVVSALGDRDVVILSGHTHGGQICLPFPTPRMVCMWHLHCPQVAGWYRNRRARLYVNRGIGVTGKPYRYRCPAEMAVMTLTPSIS